MPSEVRRSFHPLPQADWIMIIKGEEVEVTKLETVTRSRDKRKIRDDDTEVETRTSKQPIKEDPVQEDARFKHMAEEFRRKRVATGDVKEKWVPDIEQMRRGPRTKKPILCSNIFFLRIRKRQTRRGRIVEKEQTGAAESSRGKSKRRSCSSTYSTARITRSGDRTTN